MSSGSYIMNIGPQHPSAHGVLSAIVLCHGETIAASDMVFGYLHRGTEKLCETKHLKVLSCI